MEINNAVVSKGHQDKTEQVKALSDAIKELEVDTKKLRDMDFSEEIDNEMTESILDKVVRLFEAVVKLID